MVIDANNENALRNYTEEKKRLIFEKTAKGYYDSSDIALVRVTDHLPENSIVPAICNVPFLTRINDLSSRVAYDILKENEQKISGMSYLDPVIEDELLKKSKEYSPLSTQYRSSIHFTLNGIVQNHQYGTFDSPFVIVESFKQHEDDSNILSVRGDDTYFKDGICLSSDSVVLVPIEYKDKLDDRVGNIVYYIGNRDRALEMYLVRIGIIPEKIKDSYVEESKTSSLLNGFIESKGYLRERHCYHPCYKIDDERSLELWKYYDDKFYSYLFKKIYPQGTHLSELDILKSKFDLGFFDKRPMNTLKNIVYSLGLYEYKQIVDSYNQELIQKVSSGEYPTNNEILGIAPIDITNVRKNNK